MNAWQRLAWIEWYRSFRLTGKDNHDFFWLAVLLLLTLTLALLLWGSREGLLNKFVDVSLGNIEGAGIPIWVAANNMEGIDRTLLEQATMSFYPYREVEHYELALPSHYHIKADLWDNKVPFAGWAVGVDDPLWQIGVKNANTLTTTDDWFPIPLEIILNRSLFQQYFNCATYIKVVQQQLPFWTPPPTTADPLYCLANQKIWLEAQVSTERRELLPFQIHWQTRIPTMQQLAFLLPLSILHTFKVASYFTHLNYYPEAQVSHEDNHNRIKELMLWGETTAAQSLNSLTACLTNAQVIDDVRVVLKYPLPRYWVLSCLKNSEIPLKQEQQRLTPPYFFIIEEAETHYFKYHRQDLLKISCNKSQAKCQPCQQVIQSSAWTSLKNTDCRPEQTTADMMALIGSYQKALAYVTDRKELATTLTQITQLPQSATDASQAFYIHPTYNDAFVRFLLIQQVIELLKVIYSPFFLIFLIILLIVQTGLVITHRRHNYGILLAKGFSWQQLYQMILLQLGLSFSVAFGIASIVIEIVRQGLSWGFANIVTVKPYIDHVVVNNFDLIPLSWLDYGAVGIITLLMSYLIATLIFRTTIPPQQVEPAYLFRL
jgi:hypothetical protein